MIRDCGSWTSPITPELIVTDSVRLGDLCLDQDNAYWIEGRPNEGGRNVLVCLKRVPTITNQPIDLTPTPFNVRSRVHEYGGGAFTVTDGQIVFSNDTDGCLYHQSVKDLQDGATEPVQLTQPDQRRYADLVIDTERNRLICVAEDHSPVENGTSLEPVNKIVSIDLETGQTSDLVDGCLFPGSGDFYANPRLSPDGRQLAWISWNHPDMPWDNTELWLSELDQNGQLTTTERVAGESAPASIFQPEWSPDGNLYYVSDQNGWWNLYRLNPSAKRLSPEPIVEIEAEIGLPQWIFGMSTYGFLSTHQISCAYTQNGIWHLATINLNQPKLESHPLPFTDFGGTLKVNGHGTLLTASSPDTFSAVVFISADQLECRRAAGTAISVNTLRSSNQVRVSDRYLSTPETIEFPTEDGLTAHAFFYPPHNADFSVSEGEKPPLIVISHGGPTGATGNGLSLHTQFWTSRGFAVLDVNYGGSTGYGRDYRHRLRGKWGVVDIDDCINGAKHLIQRGRVDPDQIVIRGSSAGGYTTLSALAFRDFFKVGASYYGIGNLEALAKDTHKFESRYLDYLIGPYPENRQTYLDRSPIHFVDQLNCPVIFFQGLEDKVVPPNQAQAMVEALDKKGLTVAHVTFLQEGHGFRKAENIKQALKAELYFYAEVMGFDLPDQSVILEIRNADSNLP